ncbi:hypothetical protein SEUCBS139899_003996 [Sporothrix eucalyptigena]
MDQSYHSSSRSSTQSMNKYWIPHKDIHKKVIMTHIQFYLGSEATVRSYTKDEQIDDICVKSMEMWERQAAARMLASDGTSPPSSSASPKAPLKRPLHQPVVIARASSRMSGGSFSDSRSRRSSSHSHRSSSSSSSHHHHSRHNHNHSYSRPQHHLPHPPQYQQRQLHQSQQQQQEAPQQQLAPQPHQQQFYAQQHHYHHRPSSSHSQHMAHSYHAGWVPLSPTQDGLTSDCERQF